MSLQVKAYIWAQAPDHPHCPILVCSLPPASIEASISLQAEDSQTWCLQGVQTQLAQATELYKLNTPKTVQM